MITFEDDDDRVQHFMHDDDISVERRRRAARTGEKEMREMKKMTLEEEMMTGRKRL